MRSVRNPLHYWSWEIPEAWGGEIGILSFRNPTEPFNMLTLESYREGEQFFEYLCVADESDPDACKLKVIILTGDEVQVGNEWKRSFCAGGSPDTIVKPLIERGDGGEKRLFTRMTVNLVRRMIECPQVVIAAVDGPCMGAGAAIASAAMLRIGTPRAKVGFLFNQMGLCCADMGATFFLQRIIGAGRAADFLLLGRDRMIDAETGYRLGFFNELVQPGSLIGESVSLARNVIARNSPTGLAASKRAFYHQLGDWRAALDFEEALQAELMATGAEMGLGLDAFLRDRKSPQPDYSSAPRRHLVLPTALSQNE